MTIGTATTVDEAVAVRRRAEEGRRIAAQTRGRTLIATSQFGARLWAQFLGVDIDDVHVVYPFAEPCFARQVRPASDPAIVRILYAGRLSPEKGIYTFLEMLHYGVLPLSLKHSSQVDREQWSYDLRRLSEGKIADVVRDMVRSDRFQDVHDVSSERTAIGGGSIGSGPLPRAGRGRVEQVPAAPQRLSQAIGEGFDHDCAVVVVGGLEAGDVLINPDAGRDSEHADPVLLATGVDADSLVAEGFEALCDDARAIAALIREGGSEGIEEYLETKYVAMKL